VTCREAYDKLEKMSPMDIKNGLLDILGWQVRKNQRLYHIGFYLNRMFYHKKVKGLEEFTLNIGKKVDKLGGFYD